VDLSGQPPGHPQIRVKDFQLLDADPCRSWAS
jgi:hypothetical protein